MTKGRKKFALAAVAVLVVVLGVIALQVSRGGPKYKGQSIDEWLARYNTAKSLNWPRPDNPADEAIRALGTNCFPEIVERLRVRDSKVKRKVVRFVNRLRLGIELRSQERAHREALGALGALGMAAIPVVPQVADAVESMDSSCAIFAGFWLESLGSDAEAAIPVYLRILNSPARGVPRYFAVQTLSAIGGRQRELVLPALVASLSDSNFFVRLQATNEMTREQWSTPKLQLAQPDPARWNLDQLLNGKDPERMGALYFFGAEPQLAPEVLPLLMTNLASTNVQVLELSARALGSYGEAAKGSLPLLSNLLAHEKKFVRLAASNSIERISAMSAGRD